MTSNTLKSFWQAYPESHLHCVITMIGTYTYHLVTTLISSNVDVVAITEKVGSGFLDYLKEQSIEQLAIDIQQSREDKENHYIHDMPI